MMEKPSFRRRLRSFRWLLLVLLVLFIGVGGVTLWGVFGLDRLTGLQLLPVSLKSLLKANYLKDPMANLIPPMELSLINSALYESGSPTDVAQRLGTLFNGLKTSVPTIQSGTPGVSLATPSATVFFATASLLPDTPTSSQPATTLTLTLPLTETPSQTATGLVSATSTTRPGLPFPTATRPVRTNTKPPAATIKPNSSATPAPSTPTHTAAPATATSAPPTHTPPPPATKTTPPYPPPPTGYP